MGNNIKSNDMAKKNVFKQKEEKTVLLRNDLASFAGRDLSRYLQYACAVGKHEILRFLPAGCYLHSSGYLHGDELSKENGKIT